MYRVCTSKEELDKCPTDECEAYYYKNSRPDLQEDPGKGRGFCDSSPRQERY